MIKNGFKFGIGFMIAQSAIRVGSRAMVTTLDRHHDVIVDKMANVFEKFIFGGGGKS